MLLRDKMAAEKQKDSMAIDLLNVITRKKFTKILCVLDASKAVNKRPHMQP